MKENLSFRDAHNNSAYLSTTSNSADFVDLRSCIFMLII